MSLMFWKKSESEMKWNSEHLLEPATLEINAIWRIQYFSWYFLNTTKRDFNNFNIGTANKTQKKFVYLQEIGKQIKSSL